MEHDKNSVEAAINARVNALENADHDEENDETKGSVRVVSGSGFRYVVPFPWRLHQMLEAIEEAGDDAVVSWLPDCQHFQVHNPQLFVQKIIPKFFKQKSYKSFQRQLHLYGFQRETDGPNRGAYFHESFLKADRQLALEISRIKAPKRRRTPPQHKTGSKLTKTESKKLKTNSSSVVDRCQPLPIEQAQILSLSLSGPVRNITAMLACPSKPSFDPVRTFRATCSCSHQHQNDGAHICMPAAKPVSPVSDDGISNSGNSVRETYEWLINSGVPFSAFDPVAIEPNPCASSGLYDCVDDIKSLFSESRCVSPKAVPALGLVSSSHLESPLSEPSFGLHLEDASLQIPQDILGEFNTAIWGL